MISVHRVTKRYRGRTVLDDVSFDAPAGAITGLLGPNGSGKTTLLKGVLGLTTMDEGRFVLDADGDGRSRVGASLDITGFRREIRIVDAIAGHVRRYGLRTDPAAILDRVGLSDHRQRAGTLSLGMTQRLRIAMALAVPTRALILDEPLNGLDPAGIRWVRGLLREHADGGGSVVLSSHLLTEAEKVVDKVVILDAGRVRAEGALADLVPSGGCLETVFFGVTRSEESRAGRVAPEGATSSWKGIAS